MKFCNEVMDYKPDLEVETPVVVDSAGPAEGSPRSFKSTTIDVNAPPFGTVPEEQEATFDDQEKATFLDMLEDKDMECLFGDTPEALKQSLRKGQIKGLLFKLTFALVLCKHAYTWEQKHLPVESICPLPEHAQQQKLFNLFVTQ